MAAYSSIAERDRAHETETMVSKVFGAGAIAHPVGPYMVVGMRVEGYDGYDWSPYTHFNILRGPNDEWLSDYPTAVGNFKADYMQTSSVKVLHTEIVNNFRARENYEKIRFTAMPYAQSDAGLWIQDLADSYGADSRGLFYR